MFKKAIDLAQIPDYTGNSCVHKPTQKENQHESAPKNSCSWCGFPALLRFCLYRTVPAQHDCNPDCFRSLHPCGLPKQLPKCSRLDLDKPHRTGAVHRPPEYLVRWQSYKTVTLEQRRQFQQLVEDSVNAWTDCLRGYDDWPYDHVTVKIVGWAVLDRNCLLDLQPDEVVYDSLISDYDSTYDTSNGYETIPNKLPSAPSERSRMEHFMDTNYVYPGERFDMYLWATQGFPSIGGCGGDWGQRLSDDAYLNMLNGTNLHVLEHELGHGW